MCHFDYLNILFLCWTDYSFFGQCTEIPAFSVESFFVYPHPTPAAYTQQEGREEGRKKMLALFFFPLFL